MISEWKDSGIGSDDSLVAILESEIDRFGETSEFGAQSEEFGIASIELPVIDLAITDNYYSALFEFLFALETGSPEPLERAISRIDNSLSIDFPEKRSSLSKVVLFDIM